MIGEDFHFGHRARGDITLLEHMGAELGFGVRPIHLVEGPDGPYSSTAIRRLVASGDVEQAAAALGRPHEVRGVVVHGDQRGRTIGFPTANVVPGPKFCVPAVGVYAGRVRAVGDGDPARWHDAVVNFGVRPTFRADPASAPAPLVEAHLFDFDGDLYDREVDVGFVARLRDERRFGGVDELRHQIEADAAAARHGCETATLPARDTGERVRTRRTRLTGAVAALVLSLGAAACGSSGTSEESAAGTSTTTTTQAPTAEQLQGALLTPTDLPGYSQYARGRDRDRQRH